MTSVVTGPAPGDGERRPRGDDGWVHSVNVGLPRTIEYHGRTIVTAIFKEPVTGRVAVRGINVVGDLQADRAVHGGPDKALYAYALEDTQWWSDRRGATLGPGSFGENLTLRGVAVTDAVVGSRWRIGDMVAEVAQPRMPCYKLAMRMDDPMFVRTFTLARRPGAYLRIVEPGTIASGDPVETLSVPEHGVTVQQVADAVAGLGPISPVLAANELAAGLRDWLTARAARSVRRGTDEAALDG